MPSKWNNSTKVAVIWKNYGPYHIARTRALGKTFDLCPIELSSFERFYGWSVTEKESLNIKTLTDGAWEGQNPLRVTSRLLRALEGAKPKVLLIPGYDTLPAIAAALWGKVRGTVNIMMCATTYRDRKRFYIKEKVKGLLVRALFDRAIVGGKRSTAYLTSLGFKPDRVTTSCDVVDNEFYSSGAEQLRQCSSPASHHLPEEYFLFVGRLAPEKDITCLLRAYEQYRNEGGAWDLVLVGKGPLENELRQAANRSQYSQSIHFAGFKNGEQLLPFYAFAKCFVLPSRIEPWGLVVNEAMASGLPVIVSDACGCSDDLVKQVANGFIFECGDESGLVRCLLSMSKLTEAERKQMGALSSQIVTRFSPEAWAAGVTRLVKSTKPNTKSIRAATIWTNYGHYHMARARALSRVCDLQPIELSSFERLYGWTVEGKKTLNIETLTEGAWENQNPLTVSVRLIRTLERGKPQALLISGYSNMPSIIAAVWGRFRSKLNILMSESTFRDRKRFYIKEKAKGIMVRALFQRAIVGGKRSASYLASLGFKQDRLVASCDVVDNEFFRRGTQQLRRLSDHASHGLPRRYFLFVGRLAAVKNVAGLIRAYAQYCDAGGDWDLVLVGQGPMENELRQLAERSAHGQTIHFTGFKNGAELLPHYAFAGCFVLPSLIEPWGLVVNEAMASGLPVIVSDACGCSEDLVEQGTNGFVFECGNVSSLAKHLLSISQMSESDRNAMGYRSSQIISRFSPEAWAAGVAHLLESGSGKPVLAAGKKS